MIDFRPFLAPAAVTVSIVFLGSSFVATRMIIADIAPGLLAFVRYAIAVLVMVPFVVFGVRARIPWVDVPAFIVLGFLQYGIFQFLLNTGLQYIPASRGAVIFSLIPILTMAIAVVARLERLTMRKGVAAVLSVAGVAIALGDKAFAADASVAGWTGEILFLAGVCCGATYNVFANRMIHRYPVLPFTVMVVFCGVLSLVPFVAVEGEFRHLPALDGIGWGVVAFLSLPAGALAYFLFHWALHRMSASRTAVFVPLAPLAAALFGALLLDEVLSLAFFIGLACVVAGIWLANSRRAIDEATAPSA